MRVLIHVGGRAGPRFAKRGPPRPSFRTTGPGRSRLAPRAAAEAPSAPDLMTSPCCTAEHLPGPDLGHLAPYASARVRSRISRERERPRPASGRRPSAGRLPTWCRQAATMKRACLRHSWQKESLEVYRLMGKAGRRSHGGGLSAASPFRAAGLRPPAAATPLRASTALALAPPARAPPGARSAWRRGSAAAGSAVPARRVAMAAGGEGAPLRLGSQVPSECPPPIHAAPSTAEAPRPEAPAEAYT